MFELAVDKGNPKAMHNLAMRLKQTNHERSLELLRKAAQAGFVPSMTALALALGDDPVRARSGTRRPLTKGMLRRPTSWAQCFRGVTASVRGGITRKRQVWGMPQPLSPRALL